MSQRKRNESPKHESHRKKKKSKVKEPKLYQMVGYTNEENPFGDHNLNQQFVWKKKVEKTGEGDESKLSTKARRERQDHFLGEIHKVRKRRSDREAEQEEMERLRAEESRLREAEQYADWHKKEESFHLNQARVRSKIRLVEGREKPIDIMAKNLILLGNCDDDDDSALHDTSQLEVELMEPTAFFRGLNIGDLRELQADIQTYLDLEKDGPNKSFWSALKLVAKKEVQDASQSDSGIQQANRKAGIHSAVMDELRRKFAAKSSDELTSTHMDIQLRINSNDPTIDVEFWEAALEELEVYRARAELREFHQKILKQQLGRLETKREELRIYREEHPEEMEKPAAGTGKDKAEAEDEPTANQDGSAAAVDMERAEAAKGMEDLEEEMGLADEVGTKDQVYWWQDKYRPRKPRYFNRVKTGYEWNKYNQTHYDHDNPPPKTVQGYKFNVFYPDLIDRTNTPRYILEPADTKEFCILRFSAGPPYEDIAFKIINREW
eukprot:CAMPEP_0185767826 /NCGR_PEP_ID=MMETSP1174-20130828/45585_1 /TAXON_ID=35687 /ORGANISM="Dictyocha speculum, Strain CCMP1381" /LENGTH=493 /DNA_ID=CAMNT_0028452189 /DNA_START=42 /DNA_END=1520 /DNA_ORIENTATION=-